MDYIEIDKMLIPYEFDIELGEDVFTFDIRHNDKYDFFTIDLYKDGELIVAGEKIVYGEPLFASTYDVRTHPAPTIIPRDPSNQTNTVTWGNLNKTVFLILEWGDGDD